MNERPILVCDLVPQIAELGADLRAAIERVVARGWFILGEEGRAFEADFASYLGARHAVGVANGTDAIQLALRALGIEAGARVLTQPNSANPSAVGISAAGAVPEFVDVDEATGMIDAAAVRDRLERGGVAAVMPVHLYGRMGAIEEIARWAGAAGVPVLEDAAQAHGARRNGRSVGTVGRVGAFSFYPSKNLGALGDGGAIVTDDDELARKLRLLRNYGQEDRYHHVTFGLNSRLDEIQAAVLALKLRSLDRWNARRAEIASQYDRAFADLPLLLSPPVSDGSDVHHLYIVRVARRERVREKLTEAGIATEIHYPVPLHLQPAYSHLGYRPGAFPRAERRAKEIMSLPLHPQLTEEQVGRVIDGVRAALSGEPVPGEVAA